MNLQDVASGVKAEQEAFALLAASHFSLNPKHKYYRNPDIDNGKYIAERIMPVDPKADIFFQITETPVFKRLRL